MERAVLARRPVLLLAQWRREAEARAGRPVREVAP
jgi:hypothetical protein